MTSVTARLAGHSFDSLRARAPAGTDPKARPCVLLVEDEPVLKKLVGALLEEAGYEHVTIANHNQIAAAIERHHPQCVILDSEPPAKGRGRSWADAAAIRRAHPQLPVLMFTADPESTAEARTKSTRRSKAADYSGVIDKPFLVLEFLATLRHAVETHLPSVSSNGQGLATEALTVFPELAGPASAEWVRTDFFAAALHELRTPLTSIIGQTQLAQRFVEKDPARAVKALERVLRQENRLARLVTDLLKDTHIAMGALSLEVVTFDLGVAVASIISEHDYEDAPRITFATETARVRGDPDCIAQILGNLLDNARKYSAPGSPIEVSLSIVDQEALLRVSDHGFGVPRDEYDRLFTPFFRSSRTQDLPGTGLGLHISRRLAEQHGGRLWLDLSTDEGSVFALALPLAETAS
jgi:signal transduction histidine kinase